jgi:DNA-binding winged helix-turn-helix (wHTH) protein/predicted ATPase
MRYTFGGYVLDTQHYELSRAGQRLPLRPKAFQVLAYLLAHRARVVPTAELREHVWPDTYVGDAALSSCLKTIRRVLDDDGQHQRLIRTVRSQGYRFVAPVTVVDSPAGHAEGARPPDAAPLGSALVTPSPVGRDTALTHLQHCFSRALQGARQLVFVTGEAGIGKTTLVDTVLARVPPTEALWMGYGQCIEPYGAGEAYLPLLDALSRLCRAPEGHDLVAVLQQHAPSWLGQMPTLTPVAERERLQPLTPGVTQGRMWRELADALARLTAAHPLILVLEDLQWSDGATLGWLGYVARQRDPARLLILGTYRPMEALVHHPPLPALARELVRQHQAIDVEVSALAVADVRTYLTQRFGPVPWAEGLAPYLQQRTAGNPFFMIAVVEALIQHGTLVAAPAGWVLRAEPARVMPEAPQTVRHLIEQQLMGVCPADRALLEVASVGGEEFAAAEVAVGLQQTIEAIEARCERLARRQQFLRPCGLDTWPDGTRSGRYRFQHALYQEVLYARVAPSRRRRLHQQMGLRKEAGYGREAPQMAAALAVHFVRGQETWRAVQYLHHAAENALRRSAAHEAATHLARGLELVQTLPVTPARARLEVAVQLTRAQTHHVLGGSGAPEVEQAYLRAQTLCAHGGEPAQRFAVLVGLLVFYNNRGLLTQAQAVEAPLRQLAHELHDPGCCREVHTVLGLSALWRGDFRQALHHGQQGLALAAAPPTVAPPFLYGQPADVRCLAGLTRTLGYLGYPDQAVQQSRTARARAEAFTYPPSVVLTLYHGTALHQMLRDIGGTLAHADALVTLATQHGLDSWRHAGTVQRNWALVYLEPTGRVLPQMHQSLQRLLEGGAGIFRVGLLTLLADAYGQCGQSAAGLALLTTALTEVQAHGARYLEAEIWRLTGALLLRQVVPEPSRAETCFQQALVVARAQQAKWWELRAALSLSRLWQQQGKRAEAYTLLAPIYGWFTEGFDTVDLQEAKALLEDLGG